MKACFIGHRNILKSEELNNSLKETYQAKPPYKSIIGGFAYFIGFELSLKKAYSLGLRFSKTKFTFSLRALSKSSFVLIVQQMVGLLVLIGISLRA